MADSPKSGVREIARLAGVSLGTVDRALHGRGEVSAKTREKVLAIAHELGYQPNLTARALSTARKATRLAVAIPRELRCFYDPMRDGILDEVKRFSHLGLEALYEPIPSLGLGEISAFRRLMTEDVRAILLTPGHPDSMAPLIDEAETLRNIRVICMASDDSTSARSTAISVDSRLNGRLAAELMAKLSRRPLRVAVFTGMLATEDHARKVEGFREGWDGGQIVAIVEDQQVEELAYRRARELLEAEAQLTGIYVSTANCLPVCQAVADAGAGARVVVIATDLFPDAVPWFERGIIAASIYQNPYEQGQTAVRLLVDHFLQGAPLPRVHYINPAIVLRSNLRLFREISPFDSH